MNFLERLHLFSEESCHLWDYLFLEFLLESVDSEILGRKCSHIPIIFPAHRNQMIPFGVTSSEWRVPSWLPTPPRLWEPVRRGGGQGVMYCGILVNLILIPSPHRRRMWEFSNIPSLWFVLCDLCFCNTFLSLSSASALARLYFVLYLYYLFANSSLSVISANCSCERSRNSIHTGNQCSSISQITLGLRGLVVTIGNRENRKYPAWAQMSYVLFIKIRGNPYAKNLGDHLWGSR